jgi:superfamily II DNA or RNA helicase
MRKLMLARSKYWKSSDTRVNNIYKFLKDLLKKHYTFTSKTKTIKFEFFDSIKPEHILETLNTVHRDFKFNPRRNIGYWSSAYIYQFLKFLHIEVGVDIILKKRGVGEIPKTKILHNDREFTLDAQSCANYNANVCNKGHEICGITCNGKPYVYNGWLRTPNMGDLATDQTALPCELMSFDWINNIDDFCINPQLCKLDTKVGNKQVDMCFNFANVPDQDHLIYVSDVIDDRKVDEEIEKLHDMKKYDIDCIRKLSNGDKKIDELMAHIKTLDDQDMSKHGKKFKHVIYSDYKQSVKSIKVRLENELRMEDVMKSKKFSNDAYAFLVGGTITELKKPLTIKDKQYILDNFNKRNKNGEHNIRIILINNAFKEGIDLFDVKYVHILEPPMNNSDLKQVIGRATRTCGQRGLEFEPKIGWRLHVFVYDVNIPSIVKHRKGYYDSIKTMGDLAKYYSEDDDAKKRIDILYDMISKNSIDYMYNIAVNFPDRKVSDKAKKSGLAWHLDNPPIDRCNTQSGEFSLTPSQLFVQRTLTPKSSIKGLLAIHSVGTGKTITAINSALNSFSDYTILWVTRSSLKADLRKDLVKFKIEDGKIGSIPPISYKQFANLLKGDNKYYDVLVKKNGKEDPLKNVFIIIDEAHKLIDQSDLKAQEKVDMTILHDLIQKSYAKSGKDSCKILIMTATPIVYSVADFFSLVNMTKEPSDQISDVKEQVRLVDSKSSELKKWIKGNVSYLNRSRDASQFAQPAIGFKFVGMTTRASAFDTKEDIHEMKKNAKSYIHLAKDDISKFRNDKSQEVLLEQKCNVANRPETRSKKKEQ